MRTKISTLVLSTLLVLGLALPAFAAGKKVAAKKFVVGSPAAGKTAEEFNVALNYSNSLVTIIQGVVTDFETSVSELVTKAVINQSTASKINNRNKKVSNILVKQLNLYIADLNKLIAGKSVKKRKAFIPAAPFGKPVTSIPAANKKDKLIALQAQLAEHVAFDGNIIMRINSLLESSASTSLEKILGNALVKALNKDKALIAKTQDKIADQRYSTVGISAWKTADVAKVADNKSYSGTMMEIEEGFEMSAAAALKQEGDGKVKVTFQELAGWTSGSASMADPVVVMECSSTGTGSISSGLKFRGSMGSEYCGNANVNVDKKGHVTGELNGFPSYGGEWGISKVLVDGLVKKDGTGEFTSSTVPIEGAYYNSPFTNQLSFR